MSGRNVAPNLAVLSHSMQVNVAEQESKMNAVAKKMSGGGPVA